MVRRLCERRDMTPQRVRCLKHAKCYGSSALLVLSRPLQSVECLVWELPIREEGRDASHCVRPELHVVIRGRFMIKGLD